MKKQAPDRCPSTPRRVSRRTFLQSAAAAAAPMILPASVLGAGGQAPPSERLAVGVIGCGGMGGGDMTSVFNLGATEIVALCDVDRAQRDKTRDRLRGLYEKNRNRPGVKVDTYGDFRELLARPDIDAVIIATPDHWHAMPAIAAARAGKDIYCEKPLSLTIREARAMADAVRQYARVFQTGSQQRSQGPFRQACELVRNGRIGKLHTALVRVGGPSGPCHLPAQETPEGLDWNFWIGPAPYRPFNEGIHPKRWRSYRDFSGGGTTDWGAHHFDIVQWALGMDDGGPVEVLPPDGKKRPVLTIRYASGVEVLHVWGEGAKDVHWPDPPRGSGNGITFVGDKGWIEVDRSHIRTSPAGLTAEEPGAGEVKLFRSPGHHRNWLDCIRTRGLPVCDVEIGCRSVTVCHLANLAYWLDRPIRWDPVREVIPGDDEAAGWLDRPKREPWAV